MAIDPAASAVDAGHPGPSTPPASPATPPAPVAPPARSGGGQGGGDEKPWTNPNPNRVRPRWTPWHTLGLLLIIVAIGAVGLTFPPLVGYLSSLCLMALFATIAGHGILGLWRGLLIDERNKMSLSRMQMLTWTIVVLSGFLIAALWNTARDKTNPLSIVVPSQLWLLMGISTTSLVGSPLIRSTKTAGPADADEPPPDAARKELDRLSAALARQNVPPSTIDTQGTIVIWKWPEDARLADLFQGDEIGNAAHLDLGKVQMFFFTLVLALSYAMALAHTFAHVTAPILELPPVDQGMVALLGISHAGFLANNAVPHSVSR